MLKLKPEKVKKFLSYFILIPKYRRMFRNFKLEDYRLKRKINKALQKYEIVHVMFNGFFNKPFVDFLNKNFDNEKHLVLCLRHFDYITTPFPEGDNVIEMKQLAKLNLKSKNVKKIIWHGLFMDDFVEKLYNEPKLLEKSYWVVWGGDLYSAPRDKKNDFIRKNFKGYINDIDKEYTIKEYDCKGRFYNAIYNFPISKVMLDNVEKKEKSHVKIQINNSCNKTTLEMLDVLAKFKDKDIKVITILSYGNIDYKNEIIEKGKSLFGDKFEYIDQLMHPRDYAQHLSENDILILNHDSQEGYGNTLASLYLGKKVFIRKEVSVNKYLNNEGIKIFNTQDILDMNFETFINYEEKKYVIKNVAKYLDEDYLATLWRLVLD